MTAFKFARAAALAAAALMSTGSAQAAIDNVSMIRLIGGSGFGINEIYAYEDGTGADLALTSAGATATASSSLGGGMEPENAIDGLEVAAYPGIFHAGFEAAPKLDITLNLPATITSLLIVARQDCCFDRLNLTLQFFDSLGVKIYQEGIDMRTDPDGRVETFLTSNEVPLPAALPMLGLGLGALGLIGARRRRRA